MAPSTVEPLGKKLYTPDRRSLLIAPPSDWRPRSLTDDRPRVLFTPVFLPFCAVCHQDERPQLTIDLLTEFLASNLVVYRVVRQFCSTAVVSGEDKQTTNEFLAPFFNTYQNLTGRVW